ncbi:hypothetical protein GH714_029055 [Hevea brasiliensis]|uniref:Leucine-rich repeat-containing N-terminal plant-type domain-containing protein n=1 Tax=Hevea brasiliensis TaxID=3981 RepID=A0A6A6N6Z7_HEVBR|nr:hypothetical protein GH714_029055 [Hevea brasiliensis]
MGVVARMDDGLNDWFILAGPRVHLPRFARFQCSLAGFLALVWEARRGKGSALRIMGDYGCGWKGKAERGRNLEERLRGGRQREEKAKGAIHNFTDFSWNKLTGSIPDNLGKLPSLKQLDLNHNYLTGSIPSSLGNLSSLEGLHLGFNSLSGPIPRALGNLSNLRTM